MEQTPSQAYQRKVFAAIYAAVLAASKSEDGKNIFLQTGEISMACLQVIALLAVKSDVIATPQKTRKFCDDIAKRLRTYIEVLQKHPDDLPFDYPPKESEIN